MMGAIVMISTGNVRVPTSSLVAPDQELSTTASYYYFLVGYVFDATFVIQRCLVEPL